ncbi:MAG: transglycosylase SLT domain-containing protein [Bacteroidota bacterium]
MKKKLIYEVLVIISAIVVFVCVIIRVGEIFRENTENGGPSTDIVSSRVILPPSSNDDQVERILRLYGSTIHKYSGRYDLDWRLVLAVIRQESRFTIDAESHRGAIGLMQIMPTTFEDIAEQMGLGDIMNPRTNIIAGIKHLSILSGSFDDVAPEDRTRLTLAAYNAGIGRILDAQHLALFLNDNPKTWKGVRDALPLLSKRFTTLHERAWESDRPRNGFFNDYHQTVEYVDHVMAYYDDYRQRYQ